MRARSRAALASAMSVQKPRALMMASSSQFSCSASGIGGKALNTMRSMITSRLQYSANRVRSSGLSCQRIASETSRLRLGSGRDIFRMSL